MGGIRTVVHSVWKHFTIHEDKTYECKYADCPPVIFSSPLNATVAKRHMETFHPTEFLEMLHDEDERRAGRSK